MIESILNTECPPDVTIDLGTDDRRRQLLKVTYDRMLTVGSENWSRLMQRVVNSILNKVDMSTFVQWLCVHDRGREMYTPNFFAFIIVDRIEKLIADRTPALLDLE
jgi:hypothetical protein